MTTRHPSSTAIFGRAPGTAMRIRGRGKAKTRKEGKLCGAEPVSCPAGVRTLSIPLPVARRDSLSSRARLDHSTLSRATRDPRRRTSAHKVSCATGFVIVVGAPSAHPPGADGLATCPGAAFTPRRQTGPDGSRLPVVGRCRRRTASNALEAERGTRVERPRSKDRQTRARPEGPQSMAPSGSRTNLARHPDRRLRGGDRNGAARGAATDGPGVRALCAGRCAELAARPERAAAMQSAACLSSA